MSMDERAAAMHIKDGLVSLGKSIEAAARIYAEAIKEKKS